jgi:hypothetical protein
MVRWLSAQLMKPVVAVGLVTTALAFSVPPSNVFAQQSTAPNAASSASPATPGPQLSWETALERLTKKCGPAEGGSTVQVKVALGEARQCLERSLAAEIARARSRSHGDQRRLVAAIERQQPAWTEYMEAVCNVHEELFWVMFSAPGRDDGTYRSEPYAGCTLDALYERIFFWQSIALGEPSGLREHTPTDTTGLEYVRKVLSHTENASNGILARRALATLRENDLTPKQWLDLASNARKARQLLGELAQSTCDAWPAFAPSSGRADCIALAERYYAVTAKSIDRHD